MLRNMARSLLIHERIRTTEHKAKELRGVVEELVTLAKTGRYLVLAAITLGWAG